MVASPEPQVPPPAVAEAAPPAALETTIADLDRALAELSENARGFARMPAKEKAALLARCLPLLHGCARDQVAVACAEKGIDAGGPVAGEEWLGGPYATITNVRLLIEALEEVADFGRPLLPRGAIRTRPDGRVSVRVVPQRGLDGLLSSGFSGDVLMLAGSSRDDVTARQAPFYSRADPEGGVSLVLGAGNVASIGPMDALHRLFVEGRVVLLKTSPVNAYVGRFIEHAFAPLVERGLLRVVYGGAEVGAYAVSHPMVADVHITGSDKTHDAIVWGPPGAERDSRRAEGRPLLEKRITSELGNVSPVIVAPFLYDKDELWFQARSIASQVVNNASFNCNAAKMLVLPRGWVQRGLFMEMIQRALASVPPRNAYYPGAAQRYQRLTSGRDNAISIGEAREGQLPWTLLPGLDPDAGHEPLFREEPFCSILSEVSIGSDDPVEFLAAATTFCNERLWGTLNAAMVIHPLLEEDAATARAIDAAILGLRYGAVVVNHWPAMAYAMSVAPWGGHPSATLADVQSGIGFVHNTAMLEGVEKLVLRGPLRAFPRPPYFYDHTRMDTLGERLTEYAAAPTWQRMLSVGLTALRS
jgi:acyl-CoA reductase-like NAD-dependent aldehyde dehydrogenase